MSFFCCLISKITWTRLLNCHNYLVSFRDGLFYTRPEYDLVRWLQKGGKFTSLVWLLWWEGNAVLGSPLARKMWSGVDLEKEHLQEALILRDMPASCNASCLCCGWPMLSSKWWHLPSFFPYPLLNPTGCQVTSRHGTSVLQEVHSIEYQGLDSPSKSLEKNGLLFSPHSRLGGALFKLPFYMRENIFFSVVWWLFSFSWRLMGMQRSACTLCYFAFFGF